MGAMLQNLKHMLAMVLLVFAIASPALAEAGCSADAAAHIAGTEVADSTACGDLDHDRRQPSGDVGHCAFSHGHCSGVTPSRIASPVAVVAKASFEIEPSIVVTARSIQVPDQPPRA